MSRLLTGLVILTITGASLTAPIHEVAADDIGGNPTSRSDFNGDSYADLAVGSMYGYGEAVSVIYGSASGLSATGNQVWSQDSPGVLGVTAADEDLAPLWRPATSTGTDSATSPSACPVTARTPRMAG